MADLVLWPEHSETASAQHPTLHAIFSELEAKIDILPIVNSYFDNTARAGRGDVHVYRFEGDLNTVVAIDTYNDPTDQMDLVVLYVRCEISRRAQVSKLVWDFFNGASVQVRASQSCISTALRNTVDSGNFPRSVGDGRFLQAQVLHRAG